MKMTVPEHKHTIMVHCLATTPAWGAGKGPNQVLSEVTDWHTLPPPRGRGWSGVAYAEIIGDGWRIKGRDLNDDGNTFDDIGAGAKDHNYGYIHLALVGGRWPDGRWGLKTDKFSDHFTPAQDRLLREAIAEINALAGRKLKVIGHNDVTDQKGCPSFDVNGWLKDEPQKHTEPHVEPPTPKPPGGGLIGFLAALFAFFMRPSKKPVQKLGPQGFVPVPHEGRTIWVMPDFYKRNGIRMPVTGIDALRIAQEKSRALGLPLTLPTKEMVDSIHKAADVRLLMPTRTDNRQDRGTYGSVDAQIETALRGRSGLLSGHKKEILRPLKKGKVTIYGGMRADGTFWQPVSSVHHEGYTDYSHGLRLVYDPEG
jgi:N-acetylmuramoyl-L-alanine amidase